ncbi:NIPSNAP family containing protein [Chitinophaga agrisoli]|uniref:NIPSNAP family containing protein n=1 Tax=Chitinophaga agrisoli TaxID=2607653 RepID=A0A5B2VTW0_9BACT|nr:NIPSNAP family protein [Chitinophaga agrisoli]KAA2241686.1 NIPSNAP family containing protein [Chitinophaga agrisoli]
MKPFKLFIVLIPICILLSFNFPLKDPVHQLRIYTIPPSNEKAFNDRFHDHALRIMKKYDFHVVATWESRYKDKLEFIYLLEWPDQQTMTGAWAKFMADEEWIAIKKETSKVHGSFVEDIEDRTLSLTDYSPARSFLSR